MVLLTFFFFFWSLNGELKIRDQVISSKINTFREVRFCFLKTGNPAWISRGGRSQGGVHTSPRSRTIRYHILTLCSPSCALACGHWTHTVSQQLLAYFLHGLNRCTHHSEPRDRRHSSVGSVWPLHPWNRLCDPPWRRGGDRSLFSGDSRWGLSQELDSVCLMTKPIWS